jgi:hypothetical protein
LHRIEEIVLGFALIFIRILFARVLLLYHNLFRDCSTGILIIVFFSYAIFREMTAVSENDAAAKAEKRGVDSRTTAIQVAVRVRPLDRRELHDGARDMTDCYPDTNTVCFCCLLFICITFIRS